MLLEIFLVLMKINTKQGCIIHSRHPIESISDSEREYCFVFLTDDTLDRPGDGQRSEYKDIHYNWHSVKLDYLSLDQTSNDWMDIKRSCSIPDSYLSCKDHHVSYFSAENYKFLKKLRDFLGDIDLTHYFSFLTETACIQYLDDARNSSVYELLTKDWNISNSKYMSLFFHIINLDNEIMDDTSIKKAFLFCDKTERSDSTYKNRVDIDTGWVTFGHPLIEKINSSISFRVQETSRCSIGNLLDLSDFMAWSFQRVTNKMNLRDYWSGGDTLTDNDWNERKSKLCVRDQKIAEIFKMLIDQNKTVFLKNRDEI